MIMLHEYLKLCYMSSKDEDFFPMPEVLTIYLIAAVVLHRLAFHSQDP